MNGASDFMVEVFGDAGRHIRYMLIDSASGFPPLASARVLFLCNVWNPTDTNE